MAGAYEVDFKGSVAEAAGEAVQQAYHNAAQMVIRNLRNRYFTNAALNEQSGTAQWRPGSAVSFPTAGKISNSQDTCSTHGEVQLTLQRGMPRTQPSSVRGSTCRSRM